MGYHGSFVSLCQYADSRPVVRTDPTGLMCLLPCANPSKLNLNPRPPYQCCAEWLAAGKVPKTDLGGVLCCDGRQVPCVWITQHPARDQTARAIIYHCAMMHEKDHLDDLDIRCPKGLCSRGISRPGSWKWAKAAECHAHRVELNCLTQRISRCNSSPVCEAAVTNRINFISTQIVTWCS